jgi:mRNA-degrading endonuclease RelE of RelBE toxin-antitoxin system
MTYEIIITKSIQKQLDNLALASLLWSQLKSPKFNADKFKP